MLTNSDAKGHGETVAIFTPEIKSNTTFQIIILLK